MSMSFDVNVFDVTGLSVAINRWERNKPMKKRKCQHIFHMIRGAHLSTCIPYTTARCQSLAPSSCSTEDRTRHSSSYVKTRSLWRDRDLMHLHHLHHYTHLLDWSRVYCSAQTTTRDHCWSCRQPLVAGPQETPAFFCTACKVVQPPSEDLSYFRIMDCDQTFTLDTQQLQRRYLQLQRSLHPDNFSQKTLKEQQYSEQQSALVNKAYRTLLKPLSRGLYMLELQGVHVEEGTDPGADAGFLLELMEINEAVEDAQSPEEVSAIGHDTRAKLKDLTEQIDTALREGELQVAKELLVRMKYFANIEDKVKEKLSKLM